MIELDKTELLFGPYQAPALLVGDRAQCLFRDCEVISTNWTTARIPWPRCRGVRRRGGSGLLVEEELARAFRSESALAVKYWWGVGTHAIWNWRRALGIEPDGTPGSKRLKQAASELGA